MKKIQSNLKYLTIIIYTIAFTSYELFYCNAMNIVQLLKKGNFEYNFSPFRLMFYIGFIFLINKYFSKYKKISKDNINTKLKARCLITLLIMNILLFTGFIFLIDNYSIMKLYSVGIMLFSMIIILYVYISNNIIKNIIIISITLGYIFCVITDYNSALDEKRHFMTSYNLSQLNFNYIEEPITDEKIEEIGQVAKIEKTTSVIHENYEKKHIPLDINDVPSTPTTYNVLLYVPSALGIMAAEYLGGSLNDMYFAGRLINLIIYTILICMAIKILPYKKNIYFTLAYMPMALLLSSSYSIDNYCIGIIFIFIAYCLNLHSKNRALNKKEIINLLLLFLAVLIPKDMAYVFIGLIIFILPIKETVKQNKKFIIKLSIISVFIVILLGLLFYSILSNNVVSDVRGAPGIDKAEQISYLLNNPLDSTLLIGRHLVKETIFNFNWLAQLNHVAFFGELTSVMFLLYLILITYIVITEVDKVYNLKSKILMIVAFFITFIPISIVLYISFTPVGLEVINGVQPRYLTPILPLLLFSITPKTIKLTTSKNRNKNIALTLTTLIIINIILMFIH